MTESRRLSKGPFDGAVARRCVRWPRPQPVVSRLARKFVVARAETARLVRGAKADGWAERSRPDRSHALARFYEYYCRKCQAFGKSPTVAKAAEYALNKIVLTLNAGSSSLKFAAFAWSTAASSTSWRRGRSRGSAQRRRARVKAATGERAGPHLRSGGRARRSRRGDGARFSAGSRKAGYASVDRLRSATASCTAGPISSSRC